MESSSLSKCLDNSKDKICDQHKALHKVFDEICMAFFPLTNQCTITLQHQDM